MSTHSFLALFRNSHLVMAVAAAVLVGAIIWHLTATIAPKKRNLISGFLILLTITAVAISVAVQRNPSLAYSGKGEINRVGGSVLRLRIQPSHDETGVKVPVSDNTRKQTIDIIKKRLAGLDIKDLYIEENGLDGIYLEIPGIDHARTETIVSLLQTPARLELKLLHPDTRSLAGMVAADPENNIVPGYELKTLSYEEDDGKVYTEHILIQRRASINSSSILHAQELYGPYEGKLTVKLSTEGGEKMFQLTSKMQHGRDRIAIVLDGTVLSAPVVQSTLGSQFEISGMKNAAEAKNIATALQNPLRNPLSIEEVRTISPEIAAESFP